MTKESLRVVEALLPLLRAALGGVTVHRAGDGVGLMLKGTLFGVVSDGALMFRVDARTRGDYDAAERAARLGDPDDPSEAQAADDPFEMPGGMALAAASFRRVPPFVLDDEDTMAEWGRKAWEAAKRGREAAATG